MIRFVGLLGGDDVGHFGGEALDSLHLLQQPIATVTLVSSEFGRIAMKRIGQADCNGNRLPAGEFAGGAVKILVGGGFGPVDAGTHFYYVQVDFHNPVFGPEQFYQDGPVGFPDFADAGAGAE